jgi:ornithine cyclodeaminase/alanine dehydrogenase-like protein (mu-crystallin family)
MRLVTAAEVHWICEWERLVRALAEAHRGQKPLVDRSEIHEGGNSFVNLPAWQPGVALGTKVITVLPRNADRSDGAPAIQAVYPLFDGETGSPLAVIEGTALTYRKTAADSALGSQLLSRPGATTLLMVGAGALARYLIEAHRAVRPIDTVLVWNRRRDKAERLAAECGGEAVDDLAPAVAMADIISCATSSTSPLIKGEWLKEGSHVDLVGGFTPEMRECDDEAVLRARLFVDSRWFAIDQPGDLADPLRRGVIGREKIEADLFELCRPGYDIARLPQDITLFKNGGGAHLDLFTALFIWRNL